jgi:hypothetical protein
VLPVQPLVLPARRSDSWRAIYTLA